MAQAQAKTEQQLAGDSAALFELLSGQLAPGYPAPEQYHAPALLPHPFLPPHLMPPYYPAPHPLLQHPAPPPAAPQHPPPQQFKCFACPATFDKREAFVYHLNFHSSYMDPAEAAKQGNTPPSSPPC